MFMSGNLAKNGFEVKAFDLNPKTMEKCKDIVITIISSVLRECRL